MAGFFCFHVESFSLVKPNSTTYTLPTINRFEKGKNMAATATLSSIIQTDDVA